MKIYLKEIWKYENQKRKRNNRKLISAWIIILAASIFIGLSGVIYMVNDGRELNIDLLKTYRNYEWRMTGEVNEEFIQAQQTEYEKFVDKYRASDEEIEASKLEWNVDLPTEDILYDMEYGHVVLNDEIFHGPMSILPPDWSGTVSEMYRIFHEYDEELAKDYERFSGITYEAKYLIDYAQDPVDYALGRGNVEFYSESLQKDFQKTAERYLTDKIVVSGEVFNWDVRICWMQVLPYTLSILILISFWNLFSVERQHNVQSLLCTAKYGQKPLTTVKIMMALRRSTLYWITFQAAFFIIITICLGFEGWDSTYFSVLNVSPYGFYCWQYYLLQLIVSYCGTIFFTLFVCMLSSLLPGLVTLLIGFGLIIATGYPIMRYEFGEKAFMIGHKIKVLMPTQLMSGFSTYQTYQGFAIGDFVIRLPMASYLTIIVGSVFCLWVIYKRGKTS